METTYKKTRPRFTLIMEADDPEEIMQHLAGWKEWRTKRELDQEIQDPTDNKNSPVIDVKLSEDDTLTLAADRQAFIEMQEMCKNLARQRGSRTTVNTILKSFGSQDLSGIALKDKAALKAKLEDALLA